MPSSDKDVEGQALSSRLWSRRRDLFTLCSLVPSTEVEMHGGYRSSGKVQKDRSLHTQNERTNCA